MWGVGWGVSWGQRTFLTQHPKAVQISPHVAYCATELLPHPVAYAVVGAFGTLWLMRLLVLLVPCGLCGCWCFWYPVAYAVVGPGFVHLITVEGQMIASLAPKVEHVVVTQVCIASEVVVTALSDGSIFCWDW